MIKYTDITFEEINRMTLAELNKYIAEYGKVLIQRTQRIYASRESTERTRALKYVSNNLKDIAKNINITNQFDDTVFTDSPELKNFSQIKEARARLSNLVIALRSQRSTITGQKKETIYRHKRVRAKLAELGIKKKFTHKQLDILDLIFNELGHGREEYDSDEIIEAFSSVETKGQSKEDVLAAVEKYLNPEFVDSDLIFA